MHTRLSCTLLVLLGLLAAAPLDAAFNEDDVVVVKNTVRVKQHHTKGTTSLVEGEEQHLKVIVKWGAIDSASGYEVCHQCDIDANGARTSAAGDV